MTTTRGVSLIPQPSQIEFGGKKENWKLPPFGNKASDFLHYPGFPSCVRRIIWYKSRSGSRWPSLGFALCLTLNEGEERYRIAPLLAAKWPKGIFVVIFGCIHCWGVGGPMEGSKNTKMGDTYNKFRVHSQFSILHMKKCTFCRILTFNEARG